MDKINSSGQRKMIRVRSPGYAKIKTLDKQECEKLRLSKASVMGYNDDFIQKDAFNTAFLRGSENTDFLNFLIQIDNKLNSIIDFLNGHKQNKDIIGGNKIVNISGAGVCLRFQYPIKIGQGISVLLEIPDFSRGFLKIFGKIIHVTPFDKNRICEYDIGIAFQNIGEKEREKLISYSFAQQRKTIRNAKK